MSKQPELRFRHMDEEKWQEVRALQVGDRRAGVWEKWLDFTPGFLSLYARWDPGMMVHKHGHNSDHVVFVIGIALEDHRFAELDMVAGRQW